MSVWRVSWAAFAFLSGVAAAGADTDCASDAGVVLQVLGSGGPIADDGRASSGYVVWHDGRSRVLIDAGGGTFLRFGEAGASFAELDVVGLSHLHTDHSADFPALLKSGYFSDRTRALTVVGPGRSEPFPGVAEYLDRILDPRTGAYRYLSDYLAGGDAGVTLVVHEAGSDANGAETVFEAPGGSLTVDALPVPHGIVPALGFRVRVGGKTIVFGSDQNGSDDRFVDFARDADVLVMHMVVPEGVTGPASRLHAEPSRIGGIAQAAGAKTLLLSHLMARSLRDLDANVGRVRARFDGSTIVARDLACVPLP